jgi:hypothetical protein
MLSNFTPSTLITKQNKLEFWSFPTIKFFQHGQIFGVKDQAIAKKCEVLANAPLR